ncbi:hypothetical protein BH09ACT5_BH09ACT5_05090 [soil metagenome]
MLWPWFVGGGLLLLFLAIGAAIAVVLLVLPLTSPQATVERYNRAWWTADCDALRATITPAYSDAFNTDGTAFTCASFEEQSAELYREAYDFDLEITSVEVLGSTATVTAVETGTDGGGDYTYEWTYTLVRDGIRWLVDEESDTDG